MHSQEAVPTLPTVDDVLVGTETLIASVSGMDLRELVEAMEVGSLELISKPVVPPLASYQPRDISGIPPMGTVSQS